MRLIGGIFGIIKFIPEFEGVLMEFKVNIFSSDTSKWSESVVLCPALQRFESDLFDFPAIPYNGLLVCVVGMPSLLGSIPTTVLAVDSFRSPKNWTLTTELGPLEYVTVP